MRRVTNFLLLVLVAVLASGCGKDESESGQNNLIPEKQEASKQTTAPVADAGECTEVEKPEPKPDGGEEKPGQKLDPAKTYEVEITTNCGSFTITLDQKASPATAASFEALAKDGFFDGTVFHRIVPGFVIQGGDPTGSGTGGAGYTTVDEPPADAAYTKGVVAMAKSPQEPPGAASSQFYVVTGADAGLPPEYALLGKVTEGLDVTQRIGELGDPATEMPTQTVVIEKATTRVR